MANAPAPVREILLVRSTERRRRPVRFADGSRGSHGAFAGALAARLGRRRRRREMLEVIILAALACILFVACAAVAFGSVAAARAVSSAVTLPSNMDLQALRHR